jgi:micrococcal nuclease
LTTTVSHYVAVRLGLTVVMLSTVAACATGDRDGAMVHDPAQGWRVTAVVDGDTIEVSAGGVVERVRLIGIDAPERGECGADEAALLLARLLEGAVVRLESDTSDRDAFARLLRYVWTDDRLVNEVMVEEGLAIARRYPPDTLLSGRLESAQQRAQDAGLGIWSGGLCGDGAGASIEISDLQPDPPGDDTLNLNGEWVEFTNTGTERVVMTGWSVRDESSSNRYGFPPGFSLPAGGVVRLHTGCGEDTPTSLYWCSPDAAVWNNDGDTVFLRDPAGDLVASRRYP